MSGVFQALIVAGLFLLTAVVGLATVAMVRRGHHDNTGGNQQRGFNGIDAAVSRWSTRRCWHTDRPPQRRHRCEGTIKLRGGP